jgi:thiol-disulfide isomerase/thioredoxin
MDRLPALIAIVVAALACTEPTTTKSSSSRVAKVEAAPARDPAEVAKEWCDQMPSGQKFTYPTLAAGDPAPTGKSRWINVWATWCKPCVEELPRIGSFRDKLPGDGARIELELLAADDAEAFDQFLADNPAAKASRRLAAPDDVSTWLTSLGLDGNAGLPLHLFVDAQDNLRCARLGGVGDDDYENVLAVVRTVI